MFVCLFFYLILDWFGKVFLFFNFLLLVGGWFCTFFNELDLGDGSNKFFCVYELLIKVS